MKKIINKKTLILLFLLLLLPLFSGCFLVPLKNQPPIITSTPITTATVDVLYAYDVDATDPDVDTLTYSLTTNLAGMTINSTTGLINWTPASTGDYNVTVRVSDGSLSDTQSFIIHVSEESETTNQAPDITSTPITSATVDQAYTYNVNATDPDGDTLTYSLTTKPTGMTINSTTGLINWTPASTGDYNVTVRVSDGSLSDTQSFIITVTQTPNQSPTASFTANPTSGVAPLEVTFNASNSSDSDGSITSYAWDFKDGDTGNGQIINHTFSSIGSYNVLLTVTDNDGATDSTTKTITVTETNFNNLDYLEGAIIIANDNQFLGKISKNQFDLDSINNQFGTYGSEFSLYSIFNQFGTYGSEFSSLSPFNKFTSTPPKIYKENIFIAYLTVNTFMFPRVDTNLLVAWLNE